MCSVLFDMINGVMVCHIIARESSFGGSHGRCFIINCVTLNNLWWICEDQMLDIIHRRGFPVHEAQRIVADEALAQANVVTSADYRARPFMDRPLAIADYQRLKRWLLASRNHFTTTHPEMTKDQWEAAALEEYIVESPYGRRYAICQLDRPVESRPPMKEFTREDESMFERQVAGAEAYARRNGRPWGPRQQGQVEMRVAEYWNMAVSERGDAAGFGCYNFPPQPVEPEPVRTSLVASSVRSWFNSLSDIGPDSFGGQAMPAPVVAVQVDDVDAVEAEAKRACVDSELNNNIISYSSF